MSRVEVEARGRDWHLLESRVRRNRFLRGTPGTEGLENPTDPGGDCEVTALPT